MSQFSRAFNALQDFSKVFTVEIQTTRGWEVVSTHNSVKEALERFVSELKQTPIAACRLTSPTDLSIYDRQIHSVRADLH